MVHQSEGGQGPSVAPCRPHAVLCTTMNHCNLLSRGPARQGLAFGTRRRSAPTSRWRACSTRADNGAQEMAAAPSASAAFSALAIWSSALASPWAAHAAEEAVAAAATSSPVSSAFQAVEAFAADNGALGVGAFIAAYAVATVFLVPGSVLTLAAGAIYGPLYGTAVVSAASTTGALAAFTVARTAARPWVERQLEGFPDARAVVRGVSKEGGAKLVLLLRLSPLVPFTLLNYALGLSEVSAVEYTLASWLGMLPGTFAYVYLGSVGKTAVDVATGAAAGSAGDADGLIKSALYGLGAVATIAATKLIADVAGKTIKEQQEAAAPPPPPEQT